MRAVVPVIALLLSACPPSPPPIEVSNDAGVDEVLAADAYCETIVEFFCPYYLRCGRMAAADEDECRAVFLEACNARYEPSYVSLEAAGLLELSASGVSACRAHLDDVACEEQLLDLDGPCATMWDGKQPAGAACGFDVESFVCADGTACVLDLTFCGTCQQVVADGERCDTDGVTCGRESTCTDGLCVSRKRVGEACGPDDRCVLGSGCDGVCAGPAYVGVGSACDFDNRCPYASACIDGACRASAELGQSCGDLVACDSGFCDLDAGTTDGVCVELVAQGGTCSASAQCQPGACIEGRCASLPSACINPGP